MNIKQRAEERTGKYEEGPDGYLGEIEEFVNEKGEIKQLRPVYKGPSMRYKSGFSIIFNTGLYSIANYGGPGGILALLINNMNKKNICEINIEKIAKSYECTERSIRNYLKKLIDDGAIVKHKKGFMVNPLYAIKCKAEEYKDVVDEYAEIQTEIAKRRGKKAKKNSQQMMESNKQMEM